MLGAWGLRAADTKIAVMKDATPSSDPYAVVTLLTPQKKQRAADILAENEKGGRRASVGAGAGTRRQERHFLGRAGSVNKSQADDASIEPGAVELGRTEVVPESLYPVFRNALFPIARLRPVDQPLSDTESEDEGEGDEHGSEHSGKSGGTKGTSQGSRTSPKADAVEQLDFKTADDYMLEELLKEEAGMQKVGGTVAGRSRHHHQHQHQRQDQYQPHHRHHHHLTTTTIITPPPTTTISPSGQRRRGRLARAFRAIFHRLVHPRQRTRCQPLGRRRRHRP